MLFLKKITSRFLARYISTIGKFVDYLQIRLTAKSVPVYSMDNWELTVFAKQSIVDLNALKLCCCAINILFNSITTKFEAQVINY